MDSIIFDIDGTIWNSTDVVAMAWNKALEKENINVRVTADQLKGLFGRLHIRNCVFDEGMMA